MQYVVAGLIAVALLYIFVSSYRSGLRKSRRFTERHQRRVRSHLMLVDDDEDDSGAIEGGDIEDGDDRNVRRVRG